MDGVRKSLDLRSSRIFDAPASSERGGERKRFLSEGRRDGPTMAPTSEISDVISNPFLRYFINVASDVSTKEQTEVTSYAPPFAYNELCLWYQPLITFAKTLI